MKRLSQVLAIEKQVKNKVNDQGAAGLKALHKPELFNGHRRTFEPLNDDSEQLEPDYKPVVANASQALKSWLELQGELLDVTLTKDVGNTLAKAKLTIGGTEFEVPVTYLIWLEKQFNDLKTVIEALPVLSPDKQWKRDDATGNWSTEPVKSARNKKKKVPLVLYEATDKHPAQVHLNEEDVLQGYWSNIFTSSAIPGPDKAALQSKVESLLKAVKEAREEANSLRVEELNISSALTAYLSL